MVLAEVFLLKFMRMMWWFRFFTTHGFGIPILQSRLRTVDQSVSRSDTGRSHSRGVGQVVAKRGRFPICPGIENHMQCRNVVYGLQNKWLWCLLNFSKNGGYAIKTMHGEVPQNGLDHAEHMLVLVTNALHVYLRLVRHILVCESSDLLALALTLKTPISRNTELIGHILFCLACKQIVVCMFVKMVKAHQEVGML